MKLLSPGGPPTLSASELAWLRCFDAAARCASFTKAANELHISQSAVGQQVKKLEERLGHALILRTTAGLRLTREGEQLFAATRESFRGLESAVHRLHIARAGEPVNVSCSPSFAMRRCGAEPSSTILFWPCRPRWAGRGSRWEEWLSFCGICCKAGSSRHFGSGCVLTPVIASSSTHSIQRRRRYGAGCEARPMYLSPSAIRFSRTRGWKRCSCRHSPHPDGCE
ncbi:regulatory helix-turn-helix LysR family protein [Cupriavidus plantarum]|nr:regulatory helix-turn-helix LysR family protein [Cupriavidus plantarum]